MRRSVEMTGAQFRLAFKTRSLVPLGWRIVFWISGSLWLLGALSRLAMGDQPNWFVVMGALGFLPMVSWLWDDNLRRQFDKAMLDPEESDV